MILYSFSDKKFSKLTPELGEKRHLGGSKITGEKVTFLTTNPSLSLEIGNGDNFFKYRYVVKIEKDDPYLHADDKFNDMLENHIKEFELECDIHKWFFYDKTLDYKTVSEWNVKLSGF